MGMGMGDDKESPVQLNASVRSREAAVGHCLVFRIAAQCQPRHGAEREGDYTQHSRREMSRDTLSEYSSPRLGGKCQVSL